MDAVPGRIVAMDKTIAVNLLSNGSIRRQTTDKIVLRFLKSLALMAALAQPATAQALDAMMNSSNAALLPRANSPRSMSSGRTTRSSSTAVVTAGFCRCAEIVSPNVELAPAKPDTSERQMNTTIPARARMLQGQILSAFPKVRRCSPISWTSLQALPKIVRFHRPHFRHHQFRRKRTLRRQYGKRHQIRLAVGLVEGGLCEMARRAKKCNRVCRKNDPAKQNRSSWPSKRIFTVHSGSCSYSLRISVSLNLP
jgi:hypothetical protein